MRRLNKNRSESYTVSGDGSPPPAGGRRLSGDERPGAVGSTAGVAAPASPARAALVDLSAAAAEEHRAKAGDCPADESWKWFRRRSAGSWGTSTSRNVLSGQSVAAAAAAASAATAATAAAAGGLEGLHAASRATFSSELTLSRRELDEASHLTAGYEKLSKKLSQSHVDLSRFSSAAVGRTSAAVLPSVSGASGSNPLHNAASALRRLWHTRHSDMKRRNGGAVTALASASALHLTASLEAQQQQHVSSALRPAEELMPVGHTVPPAPRAHPGGSGASMEWRVSQSTILPFVQATSGDPASAGRSAAAAAGDSLAETSETLSTFYRQPGSGRSGVAAAAAASAVTAAAAAAAGRMPQVVVSPPSASGSGSRTLASPWLGSGTPRLPAVTAATGTQQQQRSRQITGVGALVTHSFDLGDVRVAEGDTKNLLRFQKGCSLDDNLLASGASLAPSHKLSRLRRGACIADDGAVAAASGQVVGNGCSSGGPSCLPSGGPTCDDASRTEPASTSATPVGSGVATATSAAAPHAATAAAGMMVAAVPLPWGQRRTVAVNGSDGGAGATAFSMGVGSSAVGRAGEYVLQRLFADFTLMAERKIDQVLGEPLERPLQKTLQRGEDPQFDQLLSTLNCVAEHCLPSLLRILLAWYERQLPCGTAVSTAYNAGVAGSATGLKPKTKLGLKGDRDYLCERRDLAVEFLFCLVLVEVLQQLPFHPGYDDLINAIITMAFTHFKHNERLAPTDPNTLNVNTLADLYGEVIGVVATSRFLAVKKKFAAELRELRGKEAALATAAASGASSQSANIVSLIMGMKFFRVKMLPIEEFESCVQFLHDLASYFIEVKDKNVKHALAGLFVEILLPMAAIVRTEVNVPVLRTLVETLYPTAVDMASKKKHCLALFPMATSLLCVSQKVYFVEKWPNFLNMCLVQLKGKDPKMSRVALESLYRLVWVYVVRLKCESNATTMTRLTTIINALFKQQPQRLSPRDSPLSIFVKIVQFIAQERLDFAVREVIYDLLNVNKPTRGLLPERMSVGLRAFLVIADSLQQKEGEPPMPQTIAVLPSGGTLRMKKTFLNKMLTDDAAKSIGMAPYYYQVRKALTVMLRLLDVAVGRPLAVTKSDNVGKELDDMVTAERKPKIDLLRTCVAAIPRLMPSDMSHAELMELLVRLTVHIDEELRGLAYQSLQNIMVDFVELRETLVHCFVEFVQKEISDVSNPLLLDNTLRMLQSLLSKWISTIQQRRGAVPQVQQQQQPGTGAATGVSRSGSLKGTIGSGSICDIPPMIASGQKQSLHEAESLALVSLCACRPATRKAAVSLMKEAGDLITDLFPTETPLITFIDRQLPNLIEHILPHLPPSERAQLMQINYQTIDLQWLSERTSPVWVSGYIPEEPSARSTLAGSNHVLYPQSGPLFDAWLAVLQGILNNDVASSSYPYVLKYSWPLAYAKMLALYQLVDPNNPVNEHRSSGLLRSGIKKVAYERDMHLNLWQNCAVFACCVVPRSTMTSSASLGASGGGFLSAALQSASSSAELSSLNDSLSLGDTRSQLSQSAQSGGGLLGTFQHTGKDLFRLLVPLLRCESSELRKTVVVALGSVNPEAFYELAEELAPHLKEAIDRRQENARRKKRRDVLRLQLARIFEIAADRGVFAHRLANVIDPLKNTLKQTFVEFIDGARIVLESETERDLPILEEVREHFSWFITHLIRHTPVHFREKLLNPELRYQLFHLFARWSGPLGHIHDAHREFDRTSCAFSPLEVAAAHAMSAVLCCGPVFDRTALASETQDTGGGYAYSLLRLLLSSGATDQRIRGLGQDTLALLLSLNAASAARQLLSWSLDCCYTSPPAVADGCFAALASVLAHDRSYPCSEPVEAICVALLYTGCPRLSSRLVAAQLLPRLCQHFLSDEAAHASSYTAAADSGLSSMGVDHDTGDDASCGGSSSCTDLDEVMLTAYSLSQHRIAEKIAGLHPELTMPLFSEVTKRFETASPTVRQMLLNCLTPWLLNVELVSTVGHTAATAAAAGSSSGGGAVGLAVPGLFTIAPAVGASCTASLSKCSLAGAGGSDDNASFRQLPLKGEGWGSVRATEMVLNNLFYLTVKFGDEHSKEIERLWVTLAGTWSINLRIILRYIVLVASSAPVLLEFGKRVVAYVARCMPQPVIDDLMAELQCVDLVPFTVERLSSAPYVRLALPKSKGPLLSTGGQPATEHSSASASGASDDVVGGRPLRDAVSAGHAAGARAVSAADEADLTLTAESGVVIARRLSQAKPTTAANSDSASRAFNFGYGDKEKTPRPLNSGIVGSQDALVFESDDADLTASRCDLRATTDYRQPYPLPMPADGSSAYFAPLSDFLLPSEITLPIVGLQRCYLALFLLTDLIIAGLDIDWSVHIPVLLHVTFLGLDHNRSIVYEHCKRTLLNLMLVATTGSSSVGLRHPAAARLLVASLDTLFSSTAVASASLLKPAAGDAAGVTRCQPPASTAFHGPRVSSALAWAASSLGKSTVSIDSTVTLTPDSDSVPHDGVAAGHTSAANDIVKQSILTVLSTLEARKDKVMWCYEDMTPRSANTTLESVRQMAVLLHAITAFFHETHARALVDVRWAQTAHQMAVSCSSRHYAGRSLQIFRLLKVPITAQMMSDILARLVEVVGEASDELHGFVVEILLTVESIVESLDVNGTLYGAEAAKDQFMSTPNLKVQESSSQKRSSTLEQQSPLIGQQQQHVGQKHKRSTSMSLARPGTPSSSVATSAGSAGIQRRRAAAAEADGRLKPVSEVEPLTPSDSSGRAAGAAAPAATSSGPSSSSPRARHSPTQLGQQSYDGLTSADRVAAASDGNVAETYSSDEKLSVLAQAFWLGAALLESDYEYEFLLAVNLLTTVLRHLKPDRTECRERLARLQQQIRWPHFPGVQALLLKGLTSAATTEATWNLLAHLTSCVRAPSICPSDSLGFPANIMCLLPFLVQNYEAPSKICKDAADSIAEMCTELSPKLENLATVMRLYSRGAFGKDALQWTKCVVKYVTDVYASADCLQDALVVLLELLERGPASCHASVLLILHCLLHYIDIDTKSYKDIAADVMATVTKFVESQHWRTAQKILKLAIKTSSSLALPSAPGGHSRPLSAMCGAASAGDLRTTAVVPRVHTSFAEAEITVKKELPGRTIEFSFDLNQTRLLGERFVSPGAVHQAAHGGGVGPSSAVSAGSAATLAADWSSWKKPQLSQARTRERLVGLLAALGQRVGLLKSPSVVFSPGSETAAGALGERQTSICSSSVEDLSCVEGGGTQPVLTAAAAAAEKAADEAAGSSSSSVAATSEQQFGLLKEFDFLDSELQDAEDDSYGGDLFNWGARRQPLDTDQPSAAALLAADASIGSQELLSVSSGRRASTDMNSELTSSAAGTLVSKGPPSAKSSEDEEILSSSPHDDSGDHALAVMNLTSASVATGVLPLTYGGLRGLLADADAHPSSPSSSSSICSDQGTTEASAIAAAMAATAGYADDDDESLARSGTVPPTYAVVPGDEVDEAWRTYVCTLTSVEAGISGSNCHSMADTFGLFAKLFKETKRKMASVTKEACFYLAKMHSLRDISAAFLSCVDALVAQAECSFVYIDIDAANVLSSNTDDHKYAVLSLDEEYETYLQRREQVADCLDSIKSSIKMQSLGNYVSDSCGDEQRLELCHCLYKLHFHLLLLYNSYERLVDELLSACSAADGALDGTVVDLSDDVSALHSGLRGTFIPHAATPLSPTGAVVPALTYDENGALPLHADSSNANDDDAVAAQSLAADSLAESAPAEQQAQSALMQCLVERRFADCAALVRRERALLPGHAFCASAEDDVATLLVFYCRQRSAAADDFGPSPSSAATAAAGVLAVSRPCKSSVPLQRQLMEVKRHLAVMSRTLGQTGKVDMSPTSGAATDVGAIGVAPPLASTSPSATVESEEPIAV